MRILILSFDFSPDTPKAASRSEKLANFLQNQGHDLRILCADSSQPTDPRPSRIDPARIIRTPWQDLRAIPSKVLAKVGLGSDEPVQGSQVSPPSLAEPRQSIRGRVGTLYDAALCKPDRQYGWRKPALAAARELFQTWMPDVIYATCPPHSTAIIAAQISQICGAPFVTEFSDRWAFNAHPDLPNWRKQWDKQKEFEVLRRAAGIVTVSPVWAESYARRYGADKVTLSMNGFDPELYPLHSPVERDPDRQFLNLLYTGSLRSNRSDPRVLFKGIAALGNGAKDIRVTLVGDDLDSAMIMAEEERVHRQIEVLPAESHDQIIKRQYAADALLLPQWNDVRGAGTVPGKLFEYIAARRPIIATGYSRGVTAQIVRKRQLGTFTNEPKVIANTLAHLIARKRAVGTIPSLPESVRSNATCDAQFAAIDPMLHRIADIAPMLAAAE